MIVIVVGSVVYVLVVPEVSVPSVTVFVALTIAVDVTVAVVIGVV